MRLSRSSAAALSVAALFTLAACGDLPPADAKPVREILATGDTPNAAGNTMYLQRVTVPVGVSLALHFHQGTQVAYIEKGTLSYHVERGTATATINGKQHTMTGPADIELPAGSTLVEPSTDIHRAANHGAEPVVILISALLATGADLATPTT
jgi:quercetin dioxygenase-like cupin family protein